MLHILSTLTLLALAASSFLPQEGPTSAPTKPVGESITRQGFVMGTSWSLTLCAQDRSSALATSESVLLSLATSEQRLSNWRPNSELSRWNLSAPGIPLPCSQQLTHEIARADHWRRVSMGAFSPLTEPLVVAWDLRGEGRVPGAYELAEALAACDPTGLSWVADQPVRTKHTKIASGGFGKGAALDAALASFAANPNASISLNLGGQIALQGCTETVDIAHPTRRLQTIAQWRISSGSLATSGNSERSKTVGNRQVGHILDARNGQPAPDFGSVTVWCNSALDADCLSTALFVLGPEEGLKLAATLKNVRVLFVQNIAGELRLHATSNCQPYLSSSLPIQWFPEPMDTPATPPATPEK